MSSKLKAIGIGMIGAAIVLYAYNKVPMVRSVLGGPA